MAHSRITASAELALPRARSRHAAARAPGETRIVAPPAGAAAFTAATARVARNPFTGG